MTPEHLQECLQQRLEALRAEHAVVWAELARSPSWVRLSHVEGAIQELERLVESLALAADADASILSAPNQ